MTAAASGKAVANTCRLRNTRLQLLRAELYMKIPFVFFNLLQSCQTVIFIFDNNVRKHLYFLLKSFSVKTEEAENQVKIWDT
jgi:hypothetical protein